MSRRQHFPNAHEPASERGSPGAKLPMPSSGQLAHFPAPNGERDYPTEQFGTLVMLGLARFFEWQAAAGHVLFTEWTRLQQEWLSAGVEFDYALKHFGLSRSHLERMTDVTRLWNMWSITAQLAAARGLVSSCSPKSLGLPANSGRRAGFDLGRRTGALVIDFPDRRKTAS